jgi:hypothetical protein
MFEVQLPSGNSVQQQQLPARTPFKHVELEFKSSFLQFFRRIPILARNSRLNHESYRGAILAISPITSPTAERDFAAGQFVL